MNALTIAEKLNAIWYVSDSEDDNKQPVAVRRDVKSMFVNYLSDPSVPPLSSVLDHVFENASLCEVESSLNGGDQAVDALMSTSTAEGQLLIDDVVQSQLDPEEFEEALDYIQLVDRLRVALSLIPIPYDIARQLFFRGLRPIDAAFFLSGSREHSVPVSFVDGKGDHEVLRAIHRLRKDMNSKIMDSFSKVGKRRVKVYSDPLRALMAITFTNKELNEVNKNNLNN